MELRLKRLDLNVSVRGTIAVPHIELEDFEPSVQAVIKTVGQAVFVENDLEKVISAKAA